MNTKIKVMTFLDDEIRRSISAMLRVNRFQESIIELNEGILIKNFGLTDKEMLKDKIISFVEGIFGSNSIKTKDFKLMREYIEISSESIKRHFNSINYRNVLSLMIDYKLIECDEKYANFDDFKKCKGFRLSERLQNKINKNRYKFFHRLTDIEESNRYITDIEENHTTEFLSKLTFSQNQVDSVINNMTFDYLIIDSENFEDTYEYSKKAICLMTIINNNELRSLNLLNKEDKKDIVSINNESYFNNEQIKYLLRQPTIFDNEHQERILVKTHKRYFLIDKEQLDTFYKESLFSIQTINYNRYKRMAIDKMIYAKTNDTNNRLDSNFTTLHSDIRKLARYEGKTLNNIDIVNSQFAMLANLLKGNLNHIIKNYTNYDFSKIEITEDIQLFIDSAIKGNFYETCCELVYKEKYIDADIKTKKILRADMKITCYLVLFSKPTGHRKSNPLFVELTKQFPNLIKELDAFQLEQNKEEKEEKGALANTLSRLESDIMIEQLFRQIEMKKLECVTLHDGLYFSQKDTDLIKELMFKIFKMNNFECTLTYNEEIMKVKETIVLKKLVQKNLSKKQKTAYKILKKMDNFEQFLEQPKKTQCSILGFTRLDQLNDAIKLFF